MSEHKEEDCVFVGGKHINSYVSAVIQQFMELDKEHVYIEARGKHISRAVDVSEVALRKLPSDKLTFLVEKGVVVTASENFEGRDGKMKRASTISIELVKKPK